MTGYLKLSFLLLLLIVGFLLKACEKEERMPTFTCTFKADSGLTQYSYYHPPNNWTRETLHLDSIKILPD